MNFELLFLVINRAAYSCIFAFCICFTLMLTFDCSKPDVQPEVAIQSVTSNLPSAKIDPTVVIIDNFEGWGTSIAWWGNIVGHWPAKERKEVVNYIFGKDHLNFNIARYNIGASPDPNTDKDMRPGGAVPCYTTAIDVFDWTKDKAQRQVLFDSKRYGADIFEAFANSPPWWMTWTGDAGGQTGSSFCGSNLRPEYNAAYADFLVEVVKHFKNNWGITFRTVEPFNEPNSGWWCQHNNQEGCFFGPEQQDKIIRLLGERLEKTQLKTTVAAPDTCSVREAIDNYKYKYSSEAKSYIGQINTHTYNPDGDITLGAIARNDGKRLWVSEFGLGKGDCQSMDGGMALAQHIMSDLINLSPAAWVHWQPVGFGGCGGNWGFIIGPWKPGEKNWTWTRQGLVMKNFSRFIRPGSRLIQSGFNKAIAAYHPGLNTLSLVVFNDAKEDFTFIFNMSSFTKTGKSVYARRTSPDEDFVALPAIGISNKKFVATAKARSVTSYLIKNVDDGLTENIQMIDDCVTKGKIHFEYNGNWQRCTLCGDDLYAQSNTWSSVPEDYVTIDFIGSRVSLFGVSDPGHGIAAISVDRKKETEVDFYAPKREGNNHLFGMKWQRSGRHRLKIRVTGKKNAQSANTVIAIDRIVIFK